MTSKYSNKSESRTNNRNTRRRLLCGRPNVLENYVALALLLKRDQITKYLSLFLLCIRIVGCRINRKPVPCDMKFPKTVRTILSRLLIDISFAFATSDFILML